MWTSSGRVFDLGRSEPPQAVRNWNLRTVAAHRDGLNRVHATTLCGDCARVVYRTRHAAPTTFDHARCFCVIGAFISSFRRRRPPAIWPLCLPLCRWPFRLRCSVCRCAAGRFVGAAPSRLSSLGWVYPSALLARFGLPVGSPRSSRAARRPFPSRLAPSSAHEGLDVRFEVVTPSARSYTDFDCVQRWSLPPQCVRFEVVTPSAKMMVSSRTPE